MRQPWFFMLNPNEDIAEKDPVRIVDAVVELSLIHI